MINEHAEKRAQIFSISKIKIHTFNVFRHYKRQRSIFKALNQGLNEQMHFDVSMIRTAVSNTSVPSHLVEPSVPGRPSTGPLRTGCTGNSNVS